MTVQIEPLTWEVLDYWKASGLPYGDVHPNPMFISRKDDGSINGLLALSRDSSIRVVVVAPLIAARGATMFKLVDALEKVLAEKGLYRYSFYLNASSPDYYIKQVKELAADGVLQYLGTSDTGAEWYERQMILSERVA